MLASILAAEGAPATLRSAAAVPSFAYPEAAAKALGRAVERGTWLRRPAGTVPLLDRIDNQVAAALVAEALGASDEVWLAPAETRALLAAYGLPVVEERVCATPE